MNLLSGVPTAVTTVPGENKIVIVCSSSTTDDAGDHIDRRQGEGSAAAGSDLSPSLDASEIE